MKETIFRAIHESLGAKMVEFAGFYMPIQYEGLSVEHVHVRKKVGVFDVSHMGEFTVKGPNALSLLQYITSNDVAALHPGKIQYSCFPNGKGGIVDDLLVYQIAENDYLLVVNAANIDKDWAWVSKQNEKFGAEIANISDSISQLAVQGPLALKAMQKLTAENVVDMEYYTTKTITFAGIPNVIFSTTGYTGAGGCEIYFKNEDAEKVWNAVLKPVKNLISNLSDWPPVTPSALKWDFASTDMKSMIRSLPLKPVWVGLLNLLIIRTLSIKTICCNSKLTD